MRIHNDAALYSGASFSVPDAYGLRTCADGSPTSGCWLLPSLGGMGLPAYWSATCPAQGGADADGTWCLRGGGCDAWYCNVRDSRTPEEYLVDSFRAARAAGPRSQSTVGGDVGVAYHGNNSSNSKMNILTPDAGSWVKVVCDGTNWFINAWLDSATNTGIPFADQ